MNIERDAKEEYCCNTENEDTNRSERKMVYGSVPKYSRSTVLHRRSDRKGLVTHPYVHRAVSVPRGFKKELTQVLVWYDITRE